MPPVAREVVRSPGEQIQAGVRAELECQFGASFADIRIHRDTIADRAASVLGARAFTFGRDIVFARGEYQPESKSGREVLGHELAHAVQQAGVPDQLGALRTVRVTAEGSAPEQEAMRAATAVAAGEPVGQLTSLSGAPARLALLPGQPAGGCGLCYGTPADAGTAAHALIASAFNTQRPQVDTEVELFLLPSPGDENGRLDLAQVSADGNSIAIGEVKPANPAGLLQGDLDLFWYEDQLTRQGFRVTRLRVPPPLRPIAFPTLAPADCPQAQQLFVDPPVHGIYAYWCMPDRYELLRECDCGGRRRRRREPVVVEEPARQPVAERRPERRRQPEPTRAPAPEAPEPERRPVPVPTLPRVTALEPEMNQFRPTIEQQLRRRIGPIPPGTRLFIVTSPPLYQQLIGGPRLERTLELMRPHGWEASRNPVIGFRNLGWTMIGISAAAYALVVGGGMVAAGAELAAAPAVGVGVTAGVGAPATAAVPAIAAAPAAAAPVAAGATVIPLFGTASTTTLATVATTETARNLAAAAGVLLVVSLAAGEAHAATPANPQLHDVRAIPAGPGAQPRMGARVTYEGRPYVIVGLALAE